MKFINISVTLPVLLIIFGHFIYCDHYDYNVVIHVNELADESMKNEAIDMSVTAVNNNTNLTIIAHKLVNNFNSKYGRMWICIISTSPLISAFESQTNTLLSFTYNSTQVVLFKPKSLTPIDMMEEAKHFDITITNSEMSIDMQNRIINTVSKAINNSNDFHKIAKNITDTFDDIYGKYWHCFVGPIGMNGYVRYIEGTFVSLNIRQLQFVLFQTNQPKFKVSQSYH